MENVKTNDENGIVTVSGVDNDAKIVIPSGNEPDVNID